MKKYLLLIVPFFVFIGCGGGGGGSSSSQDTPPTSQDITGTLIDSKIIGVTYSCGDVNNILTNNDGQFTCKENTIVSFHIGGVNLGSITVTSGTSNVTPATLYGLSSNNITDSRLLNFIQFVQSLDSDNNASNGITITQTTRDNLTGSTLDISNQITSQSDINTTLTSIGKTLISQANALEHYKDTLTKNLNITLSDEPYYYQQWYLNYNSSFYTINNINQDANIHIGNILQEYTGKGIKIAVIDDGLDTTHEDLKGAIVNSYDSATKSSDVSQSNSTDHHGTAVTGILGARVNGKGIEGVASQADIIFLKYKPSMTDSETIELFNKAEEFGADIINCSWGTYDVSTAVKDKIQDLATNGRNGKGTIIVFASGNDSKDMGNDESSIPEVIAVGSTNKDNLRSYYSNYGANLDVVAPGGYSLGITTLDPMGSDGVATRDQNYILYNDSNRFVGTSAAAPIVSGVIALMLEKNPNLTRSQVETILHNSSDKIGSIAYVNDRNDYYGYGKIDLTNIFNSF